ncbi:MAG: formate--tetrahydrofolate ligase [Acidobacteria bacterium]|nr:MAG: formate--tetrahydrofolate ligase [Acidobacteriota bacterium]REJ99354.1 MAG: formate--tetrahydrofolate ligase [Acidobacteriota bacterium]REK16477.1 MAG: formate--tetrahydrofolate ligase [Acidobacteriota bacterium]REK44159.1 MAG: formate--tetrahydrofolate ligase [Acidobacteriota bacterium]
MLSDLKIAQGATPKPINVIAEQMGLGEDDFDLFGTPFVGKIRLEALEKLKDRPDAKYILVSAITPTPLGEGKTTTLVGLGQAMRHIGKRSVIALRQPSQGPTFGIKGGAAGGGYAQVVPMETFNLHLTGDIHAVSAANNLLAAMIDNKLMRGNPLDIDPHSITWKRVVDMNDRALRRIVIGLGGKFEGGEVRETGFDISVASEVMAILALTTSLQDMRKRFGKIVIGMTNDRKPVTAEDIGAAGAMTVLMRDALRPNLMQTLENTPALIHAGPFANIAHGNSSILADMIGIKCGDYLMTEAGFGADIGAEKFFNIKCRYSGLKPAACVLVATVRALKAHSGKYKVVAGRPLPPEMLDKNVADVEAGADNLRKQIENILHHGVTPVVAVNAFETDHEEEIEAIRRIALEAGAVGAAVSRHHSDGGKGAVELAEMVVEAADSPQEFKHLYEADTPITDKIETIATKIYGAERVTYAPLASRQIKNYEANGFGDLPICMAKTHLSLSHDPARLGAPKGFVFPVREVRASVGAGFIYPICGDMRTMPALPKEPGAEKVDIDENGNIVGLS